MKRTIKLGFFAIIFLLCGTLRSSAATLHDSVLKIFVNFNQIDFYRPWQSRGSSGKTGSGCIIPGNRILTNAHVVSDHTFIQVRKNSNPQKYTARVLAIGNDCDLALLTVDDPEFFEGTTPIEMGGLPLLQDTVTVLGYPQGGDKISITEGVVSRLEVTSYVQSARKLLTIQIDAAINPGNSGGPVIQDGKLVGIAMQGMVESQNIGYMIPTSIIRHFLDDLNDGAYDGFPLIGIDVNNTENKTLREYHRIMGREGGVLISKILPFTPAEGILREGDVILRIDDIPIGVDGTVQFRDNERLSLTHLINKKQIGEKVNLEFMRDGKIQKTDVVLKEYLQLVPEPKYYKRPPYYIYGGLVFTVLSTDLLKSWGNNWWQKAPINFLDYLIGVGRLNDQRRENLVVLLQVLPDEINVGYHNYNNAVVSTVNGVAIKSLKDLVLGLENQEGKYSIIETEDNLKIILDNTNIDQVNQQILKRNNIPFQYSSEISDWIKK